jgi:putative intracellular protease/amidase
VDPVSGRLLTDRLHSGRPLALLCSAPAAMFAARNEDGSWPFKGYRVTVLMNIEERTNPASRQAKCLLGTRLKQDGPDYVHSRVPSTPVIAVDRNLCTGQNPMSSAKLAHRIIDDFEAKG